MINPKNILIVRTDRIGDVVLTLPLAGIVKKYYTDCKVTFMVRKYTSDIVAAHPHIDEVIVLSEDDNRILLGKNVSLLKNRKFDTVIVVHPTFKIALIVLLSKIKTRIGTGYRWYSFLFNKKVFEHRKNAEKHELEYNVSLLNEIGISEQLNQNEIDFGIQVNDESLSLVKSKLMDSWIDVDKPIVIVHPGSGGSAVDLPVEKMKIIVTKLCENENTNVLITGDENEHKLCESISSNTGGVNLAGKFNLLEMINLISLCEIFISNSTGPLHIAAALQKFVVGFYPKIIACSKERWGPYTTKSVVFTPEMDCTDCTREQCEKLDCMNSIDIKKVTEELQNQINIIT